MATESNFFIKEGVRYEVRFFVPEDRKDLKDLREIIDSPGVKKWMASVRGMKHEHYKEWMAEHGKKSKFLFALAGPDLEDLGNTRIHGFIYFYPSDLMIGSLEVSYARRPGAPGGLITPAIVNGALIVKEMMHERRPDKPRPPRILAEIEEGNIPSIKVIEAAGFEMIRTFDSHDNGVWSLNWEKISK